MSSISMGRDGGSNLGGKLVLNTVKMKASSGKPILLEGQWAGSQGLDIKAGLESRWRRWVLPSRILNHRRHRRSKGFCSIN